MTEKRADEEGHRKIKSRMVADDSKQGSYEGWEKSDGSSPTAKTDSIIMTGVIDAHGGRNIAIIDVENAFLQSENDQMIIMCVSLTCFGYVHVPNFIYSEMLFLMP